MYRPSHFAVEDAEQIAAFLDACPLLHLVQTSAAGLVANPVPMLRLDAVAPGMRLLGHVARANGLWQLADTNPDVLAIASGPNQYISPNWYPAKAEHHRVVPTWNYLSCHLYGRLSTFDSRERLLDVLNRLTTHFEAAQPRPWSVHDAPADYIDKLLGAIVGLELTVTRIECKFKLSQNHPKANQDGVLDGLAAGAETDHGALREWMRQVLQDGSGN